MDQGGTSTRTVTGRGAQLHPLRTVCWLQGLYYLATGAWSIVDISSFQAVTGPKEDLWLVRTVGLLLMVCAAALLSAAYRGVAGREAGIIGAGTPIALAAIEVFYYVEGDISAIYLLDAAVELAFVAIWFSGGYRHIRRSER
jgi:hypothetical protein